MRQLIIDRKEKTITRSTVLLAYQKALEVQEAEGCVSDPKKLVVFGASYLYSVFLSLGICRKESSSSRGWRIEGVKAGLAPRQKEMET